MHIPQTGHEEAPRAINDLGTARRLRLRRVTHAGDLAAVDDDRLVFGDIAAGRVEHAHMREGERLGDGLSELGGARDR